LGERESEERVREREVFSTFEKPEKRKEKSKNRKLSPVPSLAPASSPVPLRGLPGAAAEAPEEAGQVARRAEAERARGAGEGSGSGRLFFFLEEVEVEVFFFSSIR